MRSRTAAVALAMAVWLPAPGDLPRASAAAAACGPGQYQSSVLVLGCHEKSGETVVEVQGSTLSIARLPAGLMGARFQILGAGSVLPLHANLRLVDDDADRCIVGRGCDHSGACPGGEADTCISYHGMRIYFSGSSDGLPVDGTVKVDGPLTRSLSVEMGAHGAGSVNLMYAYGVAAGCPEPLPGCATCSAWASCGPQQAPQCDGSPHVVCKFAPTTTVTTTSITVMSTTATLTTTATSITSTTSATATTATSITSFIGTSRTSTMITTTTTTITATTTMTTVTPTSTVAATTITVTTTLTTITTTVINTRTTLTSTTFTSTSTSSAATIAATTTIVTTVAATTMTATRSSTASIISSTTGETTSGLTSTASTPGSTNVAITANLISPTTASGIASATSPTTTATMTAPAPMTTVTGTSDWAPRSCAPGEYLRPNSEASCTEGSKGGASAGAPECGVLATVCAPCGRYAGCELLQAPRCNGSATVLCEPASVLVEAATALRPGASSVGAGQLSLEVAGTWTVEQLVFTNISTGQVVSIGVSVADWPTRLRLRLQGSDAWGMRWLRLTLGWRTQYVLQSANGQDFGDNQYWLDGGAGGVAMRYYDVPRDIFLRLEVTTATQVGAASASPCRFSLETAGLWSESRTLFATAAAGEVVVADILASQWPRRLRLTAGGDDAWGYREIRLMRGEETCVVLSSDEGAPLGDNAFWLGGAGVARREQTFLVPQGPVGAGAHALQAPQMALVSSDASPALGCTTGQYQVAHLVLRCTDTSTSGWLKAMPVAGGTFTTIAVFPQVTSNVRIQIIADFDLDLRLVDEATQKCLAGGGCTASQACGTDELTCMSSAGMDVYFSGDSRVGNGWKANETLKIVGNLSREVSFQVFADDAGGTAELLYTYGSFWTCPDPLPGCRACSGDTSCGSGATPICDGSPIVACLATTTTTTAALTTLEAATTTATTSTQATTTATTAALTTTEATISTTAALTTEATTTHTTTVLTTAEGAATTITTGAQATTAAALTTTEATTITTNAALTTTTTATSRTLTAPTTTQTLQYTVGSCRAGEYQDALLVAGCTGGAGSLTAGLAGGEVRSVASFPTGASDVFVQLASDVDLDLQVLDGATGTCIVGRNCLHSMPCSGPPDYCIEYAGMAIHFMGGTARLHETVKIRGELRRSLSIVVHARAAGSFTASFAHSPLVPCPELRPGCLSCPSSGCQCDGSALVRCEDEAFSFELEVVVENVDFALLSARPSLMSSFSAAVKQGLASEAGGSLMPEHIELALAPGSVLVQATVRPPGHVSMAALAARLQASATLAQTLASDITGVWGIDEVLSGAVAAGSLRATKVVTQVAVTESLAVRHLDCAALSAAGPSGAAALRRLETGLALALLGQVNLYMAQVAGAPIATEDFALRLTEDSTGNCSILIEAAAPTAASAALLEAGLAQLGPSVLSALLQEEVASAGAAGTVSPGYVAITGRDGPSVTPVTASLEAPQAGSLLVDEVASVQTWELSDWSACRSACGESTRIRHVSCPGTGIGCEGSEPAQLDFCEDHSACENEFDLFCPLGEGNGIFGSPWSCNAQGWLTVGLVLLPTLCLCCCVIFCTRYARIGTQGKDHENGEEPEDLPKDVHGPPADTQGTPAPSELPPPLPTPPIPLPDEDNGRGMVDFLDEEASIEAVHCIGEPPGHWVVVDHRSKNLHGSSEPALLEQGDMGPGREHLDRLAECGGAWGFPTMVLASSHENVSRPGAQDGRREEAMAIVLRTDRELSRLMAEMQAAPKRSREDLFRRMHILESNPEYLSAKRYLEDGPPQPSIAPPSGLGFLVGLPWCCAGGTEAPRKQRDGALGPQDGEKAVAPSESRALLQDEEPETLAVPANSHRAAL